MSREFALKPGILGSVSFLSPSLAARAASLALSITSGFAKSTGGASGGGAALAWEAMGLAASSWLSLVRRALLDTDEEAAAALLDDGVVREEGGSAGGGPERPRAAAPGGAADGGGARVGPAC